jgi:hypothetical protein
MRAIALGVLIVAGASCARGGPPPASDAPSDPTPARTDLVQAGIRAVVSPRASTKLLYVRTRLCQGMTDPHRVDTLTDEEITVLRDRLADLAAEVRFVPITTRSPTEKRRSTSSVMSSSSWGRRKHRTMGPTGSRRGKPAVVSAVMAARSCSRKGRAAGCRRGTPPERASGCHELADPGPIGEPAPAATSRTWRTRGRGSRTRRGFIVTTPITRSCRSSRTASIAKRIPKVCTDRQFRMSRPSSGESASRPIRPRTRSRPDSGTSTVNGPNRSRRTATR